MKKSVILGSVVFVYFVYFAGSMHAGDAMLTLDDNAGSSSFVVQDVDKTNQFKVNSDGQGYFAGNVGIGTTGPSANLHVKNSGDARFILEGGTTDDGGLFYIYSGGTLIGRIRSGAASSKSMYLSGDGSTDHVSIKSNGNVGIGTTDPTEKFHLLGGNALIQGPKWEVAGDYAPVYLGHSDFGIRAIYGQGTEVFAKESSGYDIRFSGHGTQDYMTIKMVSGNVGIGTTAPSEKLEVSGNIKASGTVSQGSSKEFKKNISNISTKDAMNTLNKLNPVRFEYKTDNSGEKHLGFIAEDVPDLVAEHDRKHLNSMDITAVLTKVVQEQQGIIATLSARVEALEGKINRN